MGLVLSVALALAGEITPPAPLSAPDLGWPVEADPDGPLGVDLDVTVDPAGYPVRVIVRFGQPALAAAALAVLSELRFSPATEDGVPIQVELPVHLEFSPPPLTPEPAAVVPVRPDSPPEAPGVVGRYAEPVSGGSTVSVEEVRRFPGTLGDPVRAALSLPGMVRAPLETGMLLVRGANPRDSEVYIDGTPVAAWSHLGGFTSIIHPGWFDHLDFWPSGAPARFGRATAGVLNVETSSPDRAELRGGASLVFADAFGWYPTSLGGVGASVRRSYLDAVIGLIPGLAPGAASIAPRFSDAQLRLERRDSHLFVLGSRDALQGSTPEGELAQFSSNNLYVLGGTELGLGDLTLRLNPALSYEDYDAALLDDPYTNPQVGLEAAMRAELGGPGTGPVSARAGLDLASRHSSAQYDARGRALWIHSPQAWGSVRFGQDRWIRADLRAEPWLVEGQLPRFGLSPELAGAAPLGQYLTLYADAGVAHQLPPEELLVPTPEGSALLLERAATAALGLRLATPHLAAGVTGYGRAMDRVSGYEDDGSIGQGRGSAYGMELSGEADAGRWLSQVSLGLGRSWRQEDLHTAWRPSPVDQPVSLSSVVAMDFGQGWSLSGRFRYATGLPLPTGWELTLYDALTGRREQLLPGPDSRLPAFHSLDLKISRDRELRKVRITGSLDVQNVYSRRVPEPLVDGALGVSSVYAYGLPILPIFAFDLTWLPGNDPGPR